MGNQILPLGDVMGKLEKLLPLDVAAQRLGLSVETLTRLIDSGTIKAMTRQGEKLVAESQVRQIITREQKRFTRLNGKPITVKDAEAKYRISNPTISKWARLGYISIIRPGYGMLLDEGDMAYCAAVYKARNGGRGVPVFASDGSPYQLKHPGLAEYRQRQKQEQASAGA